MENMEKKLTKVYNDIFKNSKIEITKNSFSGNNVLWVQLYLAQNENEEVNGYFINDMESRLGKGILEDIPQGARTFSTPMKQLEKGLEAKRIVYNENPILTWCLMNSSVKIDSNDNYMLQKGKNEKRRIDGTASLLDAYIAYLNNQVGYDSYQKGI